MLVVGNKAGCAVVGLLLRHSEATPKEIQPCDDDDDDATRNERTNEAQAVAKGTYMIMPRVLQMPGTQSTNSTDTFFCSSTSLKFLEHITASMKNHHPRANYCRYEKSRQETEANTGWMSVELNTVLLSLFLACFPLSFPSFP